MEHWVPLGEYPGYSASNEGRVRNDRRDLVLAIIRAEGRRSYVALSIGGARITRSLSLIICEAFVDNPNPERFNTPIHLDGDLSNCRADNLAWRPRWFANRHTEQFSLNLEGTGVVYESAWSVVFNHGVLFNDVILSIVNKTWVFPLMQCFEWV
jgi:hypothetical protein